MKKEFSDSRDDAKLLEGYPGRSIVPANRKSEMWNIGGIGSEIRERTKTISFCSLPEGVTYKLTLIADGIHYKDFNTQYLVVNNSSFLNVRLLRGWLCRLPETNLLTYILGNI